MVDGKMIFETVFTETWWNEHYTSITPDDRG